MSDAWSPTDTDSPSGDLNQLMPLIKESWRRLRENPGPALLGLLAGFGINGVGMFVWYILLIVIIMGAAAGAAAFGAVLELDEDTIGLVSSLIILAAMLVLYPVLLAVMMAGQLLMIRGGLLTARGEQMDGATLFANLPRLVLRGTGVVVLMLLALFPAALMLYIPAIYLGIRWSFAMHFLVDSDLGVMDSLRASWRATEGRVMDLFIKHFVFGMVAMLVALFTCYIGLFAVIPLQMVFLSVLYMQVTGRHTSGLPDPDMLAA